MTRVLGNADVRSLIEVGDLLDPLERAFGAYAAGDVEDFPRERLYTALDDRQFRLNNMMGIVPEAGVGAVRLVASHLRETDRRKHDLDDFTGLVLLYDVETAELLGILQDNCLSAHRVAATVAVAARYLAPVDARTLGLFGTGRQAITQIEAFQHVCDFDHIAVFSPTVEHRETFAASFDDRLDASVEPADSARSALDGADVVATATSSSVPVFDGQWLEPGTHVSTTVNGDRTNDRDEIDATTVRRADRIACQDLPTLLGQRQGTIYRLLDDGELDRGAIVELGALVNGDAAGRTDLDEITLMKPNCGMGLQFAVAGAIALERAERTDVGRTVPTDWFTTRAGTEGWIPAELAH